MKKLPSEASLKEAETLIDQYGGDHLELQLQIALYFDDAFEDGMLAEQVCSQLGKDMAAVKKELGR